MTILTMSIFTAIVLSSIMTFLLLSGLAKVAGRLDLIDRPNERKRHAKPTPLVGGIAIFVCMLALSFFHVLAEKAVWFVITAFILIGIGILDDLKETGVAIRILIQILAATTMVVATDLYITKVDVGFFDIFLGEHRVIAKIATVAFVVFVSNALNLSDGIDGLASGYALSSIFLVVFAHIILDHQIKQLVWLGSLVGSVAVFWFVNMGLSPIGKIFLGDAGSISLGYTLAWMIIYYSQPVVGEIPLVAFVWTIALPIWDTIFVIVARAMAGRSIFSSDRNHIHHLLAKIFKNPSITIGTLLGLNTLIGCLGIAMTALFSPAISLGLFVLFCMATVPIAFTSKDQ